MITAVPEDIPVTTPLLVPTAATKELLLLHTPPVVMSFRAVVEPTHTFRVPVIAAGVGLTVIILVTAHPVANV